MLKEIVEVALTVADIFSLKENLRDNSKDTREEKRAAYERRRQISTVRNAGYLLRRLLK